jgi:hypothetical protein
MCHCPEQHAGGNLCDVGECRRLQRICTRHWPLNMKITAGISSKFKSSAHQDSVKKTKATPLLEREKNTYVLTHCTSYIYKIERLLTNQEQRDSIHFKASKDLNRYFIREDVQVVIK